MKIYIFIKSRPQMIMVNSYPILSSEALRHKEVEHIRERNDQVH